MNKKLIKTHLQTTAHKFWVAYFMFKIAGKIMKRAILHDMSKYSKHEAPIFAENEGKLAVTKYGTPEYDNIKLEVGEALKHHYAKNSHHPEHFENSFDGMSTLDRIEMICDINAACKRTKCGDVRYSIEKNQERFDYSNRDKVWMHSLVDELERRKEIRRED